MSDFILISSETLLQPWVSLQQSDVQIGYILLLEDPVRYYTADWEDALGTIADGEYDCIYYASTYPAITTPVGTETKTKGASVDNTVIGATLCSTTQYRARYPNDSMSDELLVEYLEAATGIVASYIDFVPVPTPFNVVNATASICSYMSSVDQNGDIKSRTIGDLSMTYSDSYEVKGIMQQYGLDTFSEPFLF